MRLLLALSIGLSAFGQIPAISLSASSQAVTSGSSVTFTYNAGTATCGNTTNTNHCEIRDSQNNSTTISSTSGTQVITVNTSREFCPIFTNASGWGMPSNAVPSPKRWCVPVFAGAGTLNITVSTPYGTASRQYGLFEIDIVDNVVTGCATIPCSPTTGLTAKGNPVEDAFGFLTFTGQSTGDVFQVKCVYGGGTGGPRTGGVANMWVCTFIPQTAETFAYAGWFGDQTDYKAISGTVTAAACDATFPRLELYGGGSPTNLKNACNGQAVFPIGWAQNFQAGAAAGEVVGNRVADTGGGTSDGIESMLRLTQAGMPVVHQPQPPLSLMACYNASNSNCSAGTILPDFSSTEYGDVAGVLWEMRRSSSHAWFGFMNHTDGDSYIGPNGGPRSFANDLTKSFCFLKWWAFLMDANPWLEMLDLDYDGADSLSADYFATLEGFLHLWNAPTPPLLTSVPWDSSVDFRNDFHVYYTNASQPTLSMASSLTGTYGSVPAYPRATAEGGWGCVGAGLSGGALDADHPSNQRFRQAILMSWMEGVQWTSWNSHSGFGQPCVATDSNELNLYLGHQEMVASAIFWDLAFDFAGGATYGVSPTITNCTGKTVFSRGATSTRDVVFYVLNTTDNNSCSGAGINFSVPAASMHGYWIDPATGKQVGSAVNLTSSGAQTITAPAFTSDILLVLRSTLMGPLIQTTALPAQAINQAYPSTTLVCQGGTPSYTWKVVGGAVPHGMSFATATGIISGTPDTAGEWLVQVECTDSTPTDSPEQDYRIIILPAISFQLHEGNSLNTQEIFRAGNTNNKFAGFPYLGGLQPVTASLGAGCGTNTGINPSGTAGGLQNTVAATAGTDSCTVTVTDANGSAATETFQYTAQTFGPFTNGDYPANRFASCTVGVAWSQTPGHMNPSGTATWSTSGTFPPGWSAPTGTNGTITGPCTTPGTYNWGFFYTDGNGTSPTISFQTIVNAAPSITTSSLSAATTDSPYYSCLTNTGGTVPLNYILQPGNYLPAGFFLTPEGCIYGQTSTAGTTAFSVAVVDAWHALATQSLSLTVGSPAIANPSSNFQHLISTPLVGTL